MFDTHDPDRQRRAQSAFAEAGPGIAVSSQVLSELYVTLTRKLPEPVPVNIASATVRELSRLDTVPVDESLVNQGIRLSIDRRWSYWDALVVAAAMRSGCSILLTEDLNEGESIDGLTIVNPFSGG